MEPRAKGAHEVVGRPSVGRVFQTSRRVRYGDCDSRGRLRLDALARYLQDVAGDDTSDLGIGGAYAWVVRRALIEVDQPAQAWEPLRIATWCGGVGSHWAERVVTLDGAEGAAIRTATIWVMFDLAAQRPSRITTEFLDAYGDASLGRKVSSQLHLPTDVPHGAARVPWLVRRADLDVLGHMNNAVAWAAVEEALAEAGARGGTRGRRGVRAEIEFRAPVVIDDAVELAWQLDPTDSSLTVWIVGRAPGEAAATTRVVARLTWVRP